MNEISFPRQLKLSVKVKVKELCTYISRTSRDEGKLRHMVIAAQVV